LILQFYYTHVSSNQQKEYQRGGNLQIMKGA